MVRSKVYSHLSSTGDKDTLLIANSPVTDDWCYRLYYNKYVWWVMIILSNAKRAKGSTSQIWSLSIRGSGSLYLEREMRRINARSGVHCMWEDRRRSAYHSFFDLLTCSWCAMSHCFRRLQIDHHLYLYICSAKWENQGRGKNQENHQTCFRRADARLLRRVAWISLITSEKSMHDLELNTYMLTYLR